VFSKEIIISLPVGKWSGVEWKQVCDLRWTGDDVTIASSETRRSWFATVSAQHRTSALWRWVWQVAPDFRYPDRNVIVGQWRHFASGEPPRDLHGWQAYVFVCMRCMFLHERNVTAKSPSHVTSFV